MDLSELFADLEHQLGTELDEEVRDQLTDEERSRQARLTLRDRLHFMCQPRGIARSEPVLVTMTSGAQLSLVPVTHGRDWIAADVESSMGLITHAVIPLRSIASVHPTPAQLNRSLGDPVTSMSRDDELSLRPPQARLTEQIGLGFVLRDLSRRRKPVEVVLETTTLRGTIDRVGADQLDLGLTDRLSIIPLSQICYVTLL